MVLVAAHVASRSRRRARAGISCTAARQRLADVHQEDRQLAELPRVVPIACPWPPSRGRAVQSTCKHWNAGTNPIDGCNIRAEVLISEAVEAPEIRSGCRLTGGRWWSYDDATWVTVASGLDISATWCRSRRPGTAAPPAWTPGRREAYANDQMPRRPWSLPRPAPTGPSPTPARRQGVRLQPKPYGTTQAPDPARYHPQGHSGHPGLGKAPLRRRADLRPVPPVQAPHCPLGTTHRTPRRRHLPGLQPHLLAPRRAPRRRALPANLRRLALGRRRPGSSPPSIPDSPTSTRPNSPTHAAGCTAGG